MQRAVIVVAFLCGACGGADFHITASPTKAPVFAGGSRWVKVDLSRDDGFSADVHVTVSDPNGVTSDVVTFTGDSKTAPLFITVDPDAPPGDLSITLDATNGDAHTATTLVLDVRPPAPSSQELIAAALASGQIDLGTSLLYRSQAVVGDLALPEAFRGSGTEEDLGLAAAITAATPSLGADAIAALRPYVVRPSSSESIYALASARTARARIAPVDAGPAPEDCSGGNQWRSKRSAQIPVRVWIECGDSSSQVIGASTMDHTLAVMEKLWGPMTLTMGEPRLDAGGPDEGGDDAIDIYLVAGAIQRGGADIDIYTLFNLNCAAVARPSPAYATNAASRDVSSGFMFVPRIGSQGENVRAAMTHELFHVLQFAHNTTFAFEGNDEHWFYEATATWAMVHWDRTLKWPARVARVEHQHRFGRYAKGGVGLNASQPVVHMYAAYIWPLFLEQETKSDAIIGDIWSALDSAGTFAEADDIIDQHFSFAEHFHTFALRNLNQAFTPGDPLPADERYVELDKEFPDGDPTPVQNVVSVTASTSYTQDVELPPLSTAYVRLDVDAPDIKKVEIDLAPLQPSSDLDIEALLQPETSWLADTLTFTGENKLVFCFDKGVSTATLRGAFKKLELVISNHAYAKGARVGGQLRVTASNSVCGVWKGTTHATMTVSNVSGDLVQTIDADAVLELDPAMTMGQFAIAYKIRSGNYTTHSLFNSVNRTPPCRTITDASGPMTPGMFTDSTPGTTFANIVLYQGMPQTYTGGGQSWVMADTLSNCNDSNTDESSSALSFLQWWATAGAGVFTVKPDGSLTDSADVPDPMSGTNIHYTWAFTKVDE